MVYRDTVTTPITTDNAVKTTAPVEIIETRVVGLKMFELGSRSKVIARPSIRKIRTAVTEKTEKSE